MHRTSVSEIYLRNSNPTLLAGNDRHLTQSISVLPMRGFVQPRNALERTCLLPRMLAYEGTVGSNAFAAKAGTTSVKASA